MKKYNGYIEAQRLDKDMKYLYYKKHKVLRFFKQFIRKIKEMR